MGAWMPTLAGTLRRRLRDLLATQGQTQRALGRAIHLSQGRLSSLLKSDREAGTVTVQRLEDMAGFFRVPPADLLRSPEHMPLDLTPDELDVVKYLRLLPPNSRSHLVEFLRGVLLPLEKAREIQKANRYIRTALNRDIERQRRTP